MIRPFSIPAMALLAALALPFGAAGAAPAPPAFARCTACHSAERGGPADIGPNLWSVFGAKAASRPGYLYSPALKKAGLVWNRATLSRWLDDSQQVAPGTTMPNQALKPGERDAIVAYLATLK